MQMKVFPSFPRSQKSEVHRSSGEAAARTVVDKLVGCTLSNVQWLQLQLPGPMGGCGARLPSTVAPVAYKAANVAHRAAIVRSVVAITGCGAEELQFVHHGVNCEALGLAITEAGQVIPTQALIDDVTACPLLPAIDTLGVTLGFSKLISRAL